MSNIVTKALASGLGQAIQTVRRMWHGGQTGLFSSFLRRTRINYRREVGDGLDTSVVLAPIMWVQRALPEARLSLRRRGSDGAIDDLDTHDMLDLITKPNDFYGDIALWGATVWSMLWDGNGYWIKVRNNAGRVVELWFVPPWMIEPKAPYDGSTLIEYYEYSPGTGQGRMPIAPEDVVHFRHMIDPRNPMKGISPLAGCIREIFVDLEASNFVASLLRNLGVPGVVISPKGGAMPSTEDVEATKTWFKQSFGGDNRGEPMVMGAPTDVQQFGFDPKSMDLSEGRDVAEERVCASIGIPAAVVGFGAGLQQTKVGATMEEHRKLAWHNGVLPLGRMMADELGRSLLPDFERGRPAQRGQRLELYWNTDDVLALQEDENKQTERKLKEFQAGAVTLFDYLTETGREADDSHKYYLRPFNLIPVPQAEAGGGVRTQRLQQTQIGSEPDPEADPAPEPTKALPAPQTKNSHDYLPAGAMDASEEAIARGLVFVESLNRQSAALQEAFEAGLRPLFESWGDEASTVAGQVLRARGEKSLKTVETKADDELVRAIIELLNIEAWDQQLSAHYQKEYLRIAREVASSIRASGFVAGIPDPVMEQVVAEGGTRAGLIDLDAQTRDAVFRALAEGRAEGEGVAALANRIANKVEGGRYKTGQTRAELIARTETKHAQNISTISGAEANGVMQMVIFDGRFGEPRSELSHIARDGKIVSIRDARTMAANMRPNCTLSFAPHFDF